VTLSDGFKAIATNIYKAVTKKMIGLTYREII
jgi:hypothetical protein